MALKQKRYNCKIKTCSVCGNSYSPDSNFSKYCGEECRSEVQKYKDREAHNKNYSKVKDRKISSNMNRKYGITLEQYDVMFEQQGGICLVCGQPEQILSGGMVKRLAVDHNHKTGKIRGLLCQKCNQALGMVQDDKNLLLKLALYLEK